MDNFSNAERIYNSYKKNIIKFMEYKYEIPSSQAEMLIDNSHLKTDFLNNIDDYEFVTIDEAADEIIQANLTSMRKTAVNRTTARVRQAAISNLKGPMGTPHLRKSGIAGKCRIGNEAFKSLGTVKK